MSFQQVYEEYGKPVYRFLLRLTGDENQAEELLQETFYQALVHIDRFEGRCSLYTWLCQIGKNAWLKECRRRSRHADSPYEELKVFSGIPSPEETFIAKEEYRAVKKAIHSLPEPYRSVFIMHALGGVKLKEVAALSGKSESWARVTFFRAKQQIIQEVSK